MLNSIRPHLATIILLLSIAITSIAKAQAPVDYNDVAVIVNDNSDTSKQIGSYFASKRNIPSRHIIHITAPAREQIDSLEFESLRSQVEDYLTQHNLIDSINYLVTTKGMPLACARSGSNASSVESDLMLILGSYSSDIGGNGWIQQPYGGMKTHFKHSDQDFYLVTRLDGYTLEGIFGMIDSSGPNILVDQSKAQFILDEDPTPIDASYNQTMVQVAPTLKKRGWKTVLNTDSVYVTHQNNVIGYVSWGSNDDHSGQFAPHAIPMNAWLPGSIGETYVSTGGRSFASGTGYGQSLVADWLAEGISAIKGYVYEPYTVALAQVQIVFDRYTDTAQDTAFNMAESYVMGSPLASWMDVIVGDPKMSIVTRMPAKPVPTAAGPASVCSGDIITLTAKNISHAAHNWFRGISASLKASGPPYDNRNPKWIGSGKSLSTTPGSLGSQTFTYCDENITAAGFAEVTVVVLGHPAGTIGIASDTFFAGQPVSFTAVPTNTDRFSWDFGDQSPADTTQNPSHSFESAGLYSVKLTLSNGSCDTTIGHTVWILPFESVAESVRNSDDPIADNPVRGNIHIRNANQNPGRTAYTISDVTGRIIAAGNFVSSGNDGFTIPFSGHTAGTYLLELQQGEKHNRQKLLVE